MIARMLGNGGKLGARRAMQDLPRGTVTFLFTDIEGSTRLWHAHGDTMPAAYARHDTILRAAVFAHGGIVYKTIGDAFQIAFPNAAAGVGAALDAQRALQAEPWPLPEPLRVRMALHTGAVDPTVDEDYRSPVLNRLGRLLGAAHGDQVLISQATMELARDHLPAGASLTDLGDQRLKDLYRPERVWQLAHPDLRAGFPPLRTLDARPNNLPTQLTQFIGREDDIAAVLGLLRRDEVRLVTLTGPGGIGKTRLSLQIAADLLDRFEHGVFFATLDAITDHALVPAAVAQALGLRDTGEEAMAAQVANYLRDRQTLLVLDNLEQVIDAANFIGELLVAAPDVKVLATSRSRLQIAGEHEYPVRPFALPDAAGSRDVAAISQYESVRLFIERAEAARPSFQVTAENAPAIAEICTRLDGLPLAIELAAARIRLLPPEAMLGRLSARLPILTGGARNLPARQQTLRGAIAWSYELLTPADQALYRRLAAFSGGATLEAIQQVVVGEGDDLDELDVLDGVERLIDHSLLRQDEEAGEPRLSMFETIREFGLERLADAGELDEAQGRHADWIRSIASEFRYDMDSLEFAGWLRRIDAEQDNLRAALAWALEHDPAIAAGIAGGAGRFWHWRSHYREGHDWIERVLALEWAGMALDDLAMTLRISGIFLEAFGNLDGALNRARMAAEFYERAGKHADVAFSLSVMAGTASLTDGFEVALPRQLEAIELARSAGDTFVLAACLNNLAVLASGEGGNADLARPAIREAFTLIERHSGPMAATVMATYGDVARWDGDLPRAAQLYTRSLRDGWRGHLSGVIMGTLMGLAMTEVAAERWEPAARLMGAVAAFLRVGDNAMEPDTSHSQDEYQEHVARVRAALDDDAFRTAWAEGMTAPLDVVVGELLAEERVPNG
jgi:predicted ATPase/class 3 adenylate cyclase